MTAGAALVGDQLEVIGLAADEQPSAISASWSSLSAIAFSATPISSAPGTGDVRDVAGGDAERDSSAMQARGDAVGERGVEARLDDADAQVAPVEARRLAAVSVAHGLTGGGGDDGGSSATKPVTSRP